MYVSRDGAGAAPAQLTAPVGGRRFAASLLGLLWLAACAAPSAPPTETGALPSESALTVEQLTGRRLTGLGATELLTLLGEPDLRRSDPPAELWQYRDAGCVLELYLYREGDAYRVVRAETRGRSLQGDEGCTAPRRSVPASLRQSRL